MSRSLASLALAGAALLFLGACGKKSTAPQGPTSHRFLLAWGTTGPGNGQFEFPAWVAVDDSAHVYVTESLGAVETGFQQRVQKFTHDGVWVKTWGTKGSAAGQFKYPGGIAVDADGNVYVTDSARGDNDLDLGNARVQVFTGTGTFVTQWDNGFGFPTGIGVDSGGNVYVADNLHDRIQKFSN